MLYLNVQATALEAESEELRHHLADAQQETSRFHFRHLMIFIFLYMLLTYLNINYFNMTFHGLKMDLK